MIFSERHLAIELSVEGVKSTPKFNMEEKPSVKWKKIVFYFSKVTFEIYNKILKNLLRQKQQGVSFLLHLTLIPERQCELIAKRC